MILLKFRIASEMLHWINFTNTVELQYFHRIWNTVPFRLLYLQFQVGFDTLESVKKFIAAYSNTIKVVGAFRLVR